MEIIEDFNDLCYICSFYYKEKYIYIYIFPIIFCVQYLLYCLPFYPILHPLIRTKPPMCFFFCLFSTSGFIFFLLGHSSLLPCLSLLSIVQLCFPVSWFILFCLVSNLPPIVSSLWPPLCSHVEFENTEAAAKWPTPPWLPLQLHLTFSLLPELHLQQPLETIKPVMSRKSKDSCWSWKGF